MNSILKTRIILATKKKKTNMDNSPENYAEINSQSKTMSYIIPLTYNFPEIANVGNKE